MISRPQGESRREAILDAALACFVERGLVQTGIEDIRKKAGASPSSMYHLFSGLPEVIAALLERTFVRRYQAVTDEVLRTRSAKAAVYALVDAHTQWVFDNAGEARFMYQAITLELDGDHRAALRAKKEALKVRLLEHLGKLGVVATPKGSSEGIVDIVLLGTTHQACRAWLSNPDAFDAKWMKKTLPALAWGTIRAAKRARREQQPMR